MRLASARLSGIGPFDHLHVPFCDEVGAPRAAVVVLGGGAVGKTSLLAAIASTRPGYAATQTGRARARSAAVSFATTSWLLGDDDPERPHPLLILSPNVTSSSPEDDEGRALMRRREQAFFDKRAADGGFVAVAFSGARWFSRSPGVLASPDRTVLRYDVRASLAFDDATRADLSRETKQALVYATAAMGIAGLEVARARPSASVGKHDAEGRRFSLLYSAMSEAVSELTSLVGFQFAGVDPLTFEPVFADGSGGRVAFDDLPTSARHLVAFAALTVRALAAGYPGCDPRSAEGVALIDDAGLHLEPGVARRLVPALRAALPRVQWILTTTQAPIAEGCDAGDVLALRRASASSRVEIHDGAGATVH